MLDEANVARAPTSTIEPLRSTPHHEELASQLSDRLKSSGGGRKFPDEDRKHKARTARPPQKQHQRRSKTPQQPPAEQVLRSDLPAARVVILVGCPGSGKSELLNMLTHGWIFCREANAFRWAALLRDWQVDVTPSGVPVVVLRRDFTGTLSKRLEKDGWLRISQDDQGRKGCRLMAKKVKVCVSLA
jgi:hypothetical protein